MKTAYFIHYELRNAFNGIVLDSFNAIGTIYTNKETAERAAVERAAEWNTHTAPMEAYYYTIGEAVIV